MASRIAIVNDLPCFVAKVDCTSLFIRLEPHNISEVAKNCADRFPPNVGNPQAITLSTIFLFAGTEARKELKR